MNVLKEIAKKLEDKHKLVVVVKCEKCGDQLDPEEADWDEDTETIICKKCSGLGDAS